MRESSIAVVIWRNGEDLEAERSWDGKCKRAKSGWAAEECGPCDEHNRNVQDSPDPGTRVPPLGTAAAATVVVCLHTAGIPDQVKQTERGGRSGTEAGTPPVLTARLAERSGRGYGFSARVRHEGGIPTAAVRLATKPGQADEIVRSGQSDVVYWPNTQPR